MRKILFTATLLLASLLFPQNIFAGGGPVALYAFPQRPFDQTKTFILQSDIYTDQPCSNQEKPTFSLKDPQSGDSITPFTPPADGTYITRHYYTGYPANTWQEICTTYAQVKSAVAKQRTAVATVTVNGAMEMRDIPVSFGDDPTSKEIQRFGRINDYDNIPHPDVARETKLGEFKRTIDLQWQKIPWAGKYTVFAKQLNADGTLTPPVQIETTENTKATIVLPADYEFHVSVVPCTKDSVCGDPASNLYEIGIPKYQTPGTVPPQVNPQGVPYVDPGSMQPVRVLEASPSADQQRIDELNQKVASLEGQLQESQVKQNILEQKLNDLLGMLRRIFPFFR